MLGDIYDQATIQAQSLADVATADEVQNNLVQTKLGQINLGESAGLPQESFGDIDALIKARTPRALDILRQGSAEAVRLSEKGRRKATDPLAEFQGLQAFREQNAILGLDGREAQEQAIGNIPVSAFDKELQRRQMQTQQRQAFAGGDVSGASLLAQQQLGSQQQADNIFGRLAELEPLAAASRGVRSSISEIDEAAGARQAQLLSGRGVQESNIRLGATAPVIDSINNRASLSGLRGISEANQRASAANQLAGLAGQFAPQISSFFQPQETISTADLQTGFDRNFIPEAGNVMLS